MAALDFPDTPAVGAVYSSAGMSWKWDGTRWAANPVPVADPAQNWIHCTLANGYALPAAAVGRPGLVFRSGKGMTMDTTKITVGQAGWYEISGCVTAIGGSGGSYMTVQAVVNGTGVGMAVGNSPGAGINTYANLSMEHVIELGAGATIWWEVTTNSTGTTIDGRMGLTVKMLTPS